MKVEKDKKTGKWFSEYMNGVWNVSVIK